MPDRYVRPNWLVQRVFNPFVNWLMRLGISLSGSRMLAVRGRRSGEWRTVPVNLLEVGGQRYLVSPRGVTDWVKNLRVNRAAELRLGRRREPIEVVELSDADKPDVLRPYLRKWGWEVGQFFEGAGPKTSDEEIRRIAPNHPIFVIRG
jgi:deazaflavin-dependent oxidoreductase (nitroreductase family)